MLDIEQMLEGIRINSGLCLKNRPKRGTMESEMGEIAGLEIEAERLRDQRAELEIEVERLRDQRNMLKIRAQILSQEVEHLKSSLSNVANKFNNIASKVDRLFLIGSLSFALFIGFLYTLLTSIFSSVMFLPPVISIVGMLGSIGCGGSAYLWLRLITKNETR